MVVMAIKRLSAGTLYKLIFIGSFLGFLPIALLCGVMGVFGMETVIWNDRPVTGIAAVFVASIISVLVSGMIAMLVGSITNLGLWLFARFRPISISYLEQFEHASPQSSGPANTP